MLVCKNGNTSREEQLAEFVTYRGAVYPWHCDHMGHMNVMWYVGKFDEASWQMLSQLGLTRSRCAKEGRGAVTLEQRIDYRRELHAGNLVTIRSRVLEVNEKTLRVTHEMTNDETGELAAVTTILGLYIDTQLRKSCLLPSDVREHARLMIAGASGFDMAISAGEEVDRQPGLVTYDAGTMGSYGMPIENYYRETDCGCCFECSGTTLHHCMHCHQFAKRSAAAIEDGYDYRHLIGDPGMQRDKVADVNGFGQLLTDYDRILLRFGMRILYK